jgi:hypothetical protein
MDIFEPLTTIFPLLFILILTALKDAFEDYKRHRTDNETNAMPVRVWRDGQFRTIKSKDVSVGSFVFVKRFISLASFRILTFVLVKKRSLLTFSFLHPRLLMELAMSIR